MRSSEAASLGAATSSGRGKSAAAATETSSAISKLKIDTEGLCDPASNKFNHIFDQSKHKLERIGGTPHEVLGKIIAVTERAATEGKLPAKGQFIIRDIIDGHQVEIRGAVVSGEVKYGTFFVDKDCC